MVGFHGEENGLRVGRKIIAAYLCGRGYPRTLRGQIMALSTWCEFERFMEAVREARPTAMGPSGEAHRGGG
jgi:hypothetical protein